MLRIHFICITALLVLILPAIIVCAQTGTPLEALSLPRLEQRLATIDSDLEQLAHYSLRSGIGAIGYRSQQHTTAQQAEWVEIELDRDYPLDEIVLVPTIWRDTEKGFQADGFPAAFRIIAGTAGERTGTVVAEYPSTDNILPRIAPLVIPIKEVSASWVRVEATRLSIRAFDGRHAFQLAELLVFSGLENVGLRRSVKASSTTLDRAGAWDPRFLVDGFLPYLIDSAQGSQSIAYVSQVGEKPTLILDLGQPYRLSRIHLHAVDQGDTVPQAYAGDLGIPHHLIVEGSNRADFSDAVPLLDYQRESINDTGPIMMWRIPEHTCRYVRLLEVESDHNPDIRPGQFRIGFAEIELFSQGQNVALNRPVTSSGNLKRSLRSLDALTDGNNLYGKILPLRAWINELARRHDLETERPIIAAELNRRYAAQKINLNRMIWVAALLAAGIGFTFLIDRIYRLRQIARIKERFASDLHDELGANLHTIGLLCDLAIEKIDSRENVIRLLERSRVFTERSTAAARYCTDMLEAEGFNEDLAEEMKRSTTRLLADLEHNLSFEGAQYLHRLKPRQRIDLFFFYKECLTNILRHSGATCVRARMVADPRVICLTVADNGHGIHDPASNNGIPASLKRRARLLGAKLSMDHPVDGGTCITLKLKTPRRFRFMRKLKARRPEITRPTQGTFDLQTSDK